MADAPSMQTDHEVVVGDARSMDGVAEDSVELVVTSPPYPMIEMWDGTFARLDSSVAERLEAGDGQGAFDAMHAALEPVWDEVARVLAPGGLACVNVGDATRSVDGEFTCYPNHVRIVEALSERGLRPLPGVLWRKPTNSTTKFMGSGTLPSNAYVTLEHEHVLILRNGQPRAFEPGSARRYESAFFWEERNEWFSDLWTDVAGARQAIDGAGPRERAGAFPFEVPFRLINMFSVYGDTVLDPFWGTGTTTVAAMVAGRNSVGYELEPDFAERFESRVDDVPDLSREVQAGRLRDHRAFVESREAAGELPAHEADHLGVPVVTSQEREMQLYAVEAVSAGNGSAHDGDPNDSAEEMAEGGRYVATHQPVAEPDAG